MTYPMSIHRCFVFDGVETARFQRSRTKRPSKRLSYIYVIPTQPTLHSRGYRRKDATKITNLSENGNSYTAFY